MRRTLAAPITSGPPGGQRGGGIKPPASNPIVRLELHTRDLSRTRAFYGQLFGWRQETIDSPSGSYEALELGGDLGGGIVECVTARPLWLPYIEVDDTAAATE